MTDKLTNAVNCCINNYSTILNYLPPEAQKQTSRYYKIDGPHMRVINKLDIFSKKAKKLTPVVGQRMKQMLLDSLDLADWKVETSDRLLHLVEDNMFKLNMNLKDIEIVQSGQSEPCKNHNKKPKRMLRWVPNYREIDSDSNDDKLNIDNSYEHGIKTMASNKNVQSKESEGKQFQTSEAISSDNNQYYKNIDEDNNPRILDSKGKRKITERYDSDSDVQPTYCICEDISHGNMVCCDNDLCPIEWFHFDCVSLRKKPKGKWFCPRCRGPSSKVMKPRKVFIQELIEYNKRKEESW